MEYMVATVLHCHELRDLVLGRLWTSPTTIDFVTAYADIFMQAGTIGDQLGVIINEAGPAFGERYTTLRGTEVFRILTRCERSRFNRCREGLERLYREWIYLFRAIEDIAHLDNRALETTLLEECSVITLNQLAQAASGFDEELLRITVMPCARNHPLWREPAQGSFNRYGSEGLGGP